MLRDQIDQVDRKRIPLQRKLLYKQIAASVNPRHQQQRPQRLHLHDH